MPLEEQARLLQIFSLEIPAVFDSIDARTDPAPDFVVNLIAENRGDNQRTGKQVYVHRAGGGNRPRHEQQRVARQKRRDDQPGLGEDDGEQNDINPGAVRLSQIGQMLVQVADQIDKGAEIQKLALQLLQKY